ncbi:Uncharacterised protein [uncultured archaeon]|nr:Uncharacterised protein [uncultured archaeon]
MNRFHGNQHKKDVAIRRKSAGLKKHESEKSR